MKIYKLNLILSFVLLVNYANAQRYFDERYVYSQAFLHPVLINPGATASSGDQNLMVNYRNAWATFPGSPKTVTLSYDGLLADKLGMGVLVLQDNFGSLQTSKGQLSFSYNIKSDINKVGFGLAAEYIRHGLNNYGLSTNLGNETDIVINQRRAGIDYIDASFGVYGIYDNKFTYGIALPSLISSRLDEATADEKRDLGFILNLGYKVKAQTTGISLNPSIILKKLNQVPTHIDLNLALGFLEDKLISGVTYRVGADNNLGFLIGVNIDRIGFHYTYNVSSKEFQNYNNGAHEITAKFRVGSFKATQEPSLEMK
jgi:type IX secretion system PorP/SprF family membrane protein